jgi:hypothetical protein
VDGLEFHSAPPGPVTTRETLVLSNVGFPLITNCDIYGLSYDVPAGYSFGLESRGVTLSSGNAELAFCRIKGGTITRSNSGASGDMISGIYVNSGSAYIHDCDIDGGFAGNSTDPSNLSVRGFFSPNPLQLPLVITRCRVFSGSAKAPLGNSYTTRSVGIECMNNDSIPPSKLILVNSIISGGFSSGWSAYSYGVVYGGSGGAILVGNTIGSGFHQGSQYPYAASVASGASGVYVTAAGNACLVNHLNDPANNSYSSAFAKSPGSFDWINFSSSENRAFGTTAPYDPGLSTPPYTSPQAFPAGNNTASTASFASAFMAYAMIGPNGMNGTAADSAHWFDNNDWRPRNRAEFIGTQNWYSLLSPYLSAYPGLLMDMDGHERPVSGGWTRGAYQ